MLLLTYLLVSLVMCGLLYRSLNQYFEGKDLVYKSEYTVLENFVTALILYLFWIPVILIHLFLFFKHNKLRSFTMTIDLTTWHLMSKYTNYSKSSIIKLSTYTFLCFHFNYTYKSR